MSSSPQSWQKGSAWVQFHRPGWSPICWHQRPPQTPPFPLGSIDKTEEKERSVWFQGVYRNSTMTSAKRDYLANNRLQGNSLSPQCCESTRLQMSSDREHVVLEGHDYLPSVHVFRNDLWRWEEKNYDHYPLCSFRWRPGNMFISD